MPCTTAGLDTATTKSAWFSSPIFSGEAAYQAKESAQMARSGFSDCAKKNQCNQARETLVATFKRFQDRHCIEDSQHADHLGVVYREALGERGCDRYQVVWVRGCPGSSSSSGRPDPPTLTRSVALGVSTKLKVNCSNMADQRALR